MEFYNIPKDKLARLQVRVHPGFKRQLEHSAVDEGINLEEKIHNILMFIYGNPGPIQRPVKPLQPAKSP